jgi:MFS family permease
MAGYGVLFPYAAIHMKSLGISVEETGAIYSVNAVLSVLIPICSGMIADKLGNFKVIQFKDISQYIFLLVIILINRCF